MSMAVILHSFMRLARPGTILTLIAFILVYPTAVIGIIAKTHSLSLDAVSLMSTLFFSPPMLGVVAFTFVSGSIGNTRSLDDGEYLSLLFTRPICRWQYVISKWLAGALIVFGIVILQVIVFLICFQLIGKSEGPVVSFIDIVNLLLNALAVSALMTMVYAFPGRWGVMLFVTILYVSFTAPIILSALPNSSMWCGGKVYSFVLLACNLMRDFFYSPIDIGVFSNSVRVFWSPVLSFVSNIFMYLYIAVLILNHREFFYTN